MNIYLHKSTASTESFFKHALRVDREARRVCDLGDADIAVIENPFDLSEVFSEEIFVAVTTPKLPGTYPINVWFVSTPQEIEQCIRIRLLGLKKLAEA